MTGSEEFSSRWLSGLASAMYRLKTSQWLRNAPPVAWVLLAWAFVASPWLSGTRVIPYDAVDEFFPTAAFVAKSVLAGESPFWNPWVFSGYPQIADPQGMTFTPGIVLPMLVSPKLVMFNWAVMLHLLIGGLGMVRLGRLQGWNTCAIVLAATVFMFGAQASSRLQHVPMIVSFAFLPWVLASLHDVFEKTRWRDALALGVLAGLTGLQLTQVTHLCALLAAAYATFLACEAWRAGHRVSLQRAVLLLAAAATIGVLIASPQIAATVSILEFTDRGKFDYATASAFSMWPKDFLSLLGPNVMGNIQGTYVAKSDVTESYAYIGVLPLALVASFLALGDKRRPVIMFFWCAALLFGFAFALGELTPVHKFVFDWIPGSRYFRRPSDGAFLMVTAWAMLAGYSWNGVFDHPNFRPRQAIFAGATALVCVSGAVAFSLWFKTELRPQHLLVAPLIGSTLLGAGLLTKHFRILLVGALLFHVVDLRLNNAANRHNGHKYMHLAHVESAKMNPVANKLGELLLVESAQRFRADFHGYPNRNSAMLFGLPIGGGYNPLKLREYQRMHGYGDYYLDPRRPFGDSASFDDGAARMAGLRYIALHAELTEKHADSLRRLDRMTDVELPFVARFAIFRNPNALPRVFSPVEVKPVSDSDPLTPEFLSNIDPLRQTVIHTPGAARPVCGGGKVDASIALYTNTRVVLKTRSDKGGWLVMGDAYLPWWRARIVANDIPLFRANGAYRALCAPAGQSEIELSFEPYAAMLERITLASTSRASTQKTVHQ